MPDHICPECASLDVAGYEVTGVYDGILYWGCETCGHAWPRDFATAHRLSQASREYASRRAEYNKRNGRRM